MFDFLKKKFQRIPDKPIKTPSPKVFTEEAKEEIINGRAKFLNGQLRGVINKKAREENLQMIEITLLKIFADGYQIGYGDCNSDYAFKELKNN